MTDSVKKSPIRENRTLGIASLALAVVLPLGLAVVLVPVFFVLVVLAFWCCWCCWCSHTVGAACAP